MTKAITQIINLITIMIKKDKSNSCKDNKKKNNNKKALKIIIIQTIIKMKENLMILIREKK